MNSYIVLRYPGGLYQAWKVLKGREHQKPLEIGAKFISEHKSITAAQKEANRLNEENKQ